MEYIIKEGKKFYIMPEKIYDWLNDRNPEYLTYLEDLIDLTKNTDDEYTAF